MRHLFLTLALAVGVGLPIAQAQTHAWRGAVQTTNPNPTDGTGAYGNSLAVDAAGNQYVAGELVVGGSGPATRVFGSTTLTGGNGVSTGYIAKLSPSQQWLWAIKATCNGEGVSIHEVTTSPAGDVFASGTVEGLAGTVLTIGSLTYTMTGNYASFLVRLNASGQPQWLVGVNNAAVAGLGWDATNSRLVVAGDYTGAGVSLGSTTLPTTPTNIAGIFVGRLNLAGQWQNALGVVPSNTNAESDFGTYDATVGPQGQVGMVLELQASTVTLGSTVVMSSSRDDDKRIVAQLNASNQWQWATVGAGYQVYDMAYEAGGGLWVLGDASSGSNLQLGSLSIPDGRDFVARLTSGGQWSLAGSIGGSSGSSGDQSLAIDGQGNAYVSGEVRNNTTLTFGAQTLTAGDVGNNYVARLGADGQWQFAILTPDPTPDNAGTTYSYYLADIAVDGANNVFASGSVRGAVTFGATTLNGTDDVFVAKLAPQLNYDWANASRLTGTYQDLGNAGTVISTANTDDANSASQTIGFAFPFNINGSQAAATTFTLSTNGFVKLGSGPLSSAALFHEFAQIATLNNLAAGAQTDPFTSRDERDVNILAPFATDLTAGTGGGTEYRMATTGTAPNRVCTIQWKNVRDKPRQATTTNTAIIGSQYDNFSFQLKLYETSGQIEFVYGPAVAGAGPEAVRVVAVGIKGSTAQNGDLVMSTKASATPWADNAFVAFRNNHNVRSSVRPDLGRTYRFRANVAQDATVHDIYTLGQLPAGGVHAAQASVRNSGTGVLTNVPVRLDVTGPGGFSFTNTQTIASLAPGQSVTVTFAPYSASIAGGTNTLSVSLPNDTYASSDRAPKAQTLTTNTFNYLPAGATAATVPFNFGFGRGSGIIAAKYTAARATTLTAVTNFIPSVSPESAGQTIYGVALRADGTILGRTADYVVQTTDVGTNITIPFSTPIALPAGDFMVGIAQRSSTVEHYPVGMISEGPARLGAAFASDGLSGGNFVDAGLRNFGPFTIGAVITNTGLSSTKGAAALAFSLAPNPTRGSARLLLPATAPQAQTVALLDMLGRPVRTWQVPAHAREANLPVADLPRGIYIVRVGTAGQRLVLD